jgi:hypothetical protein
MEPPVDARLQNIYYDVTMTFDEPSMFAEGFASWALSDLTNAATASLDRDESTSAGWHVPGLVELEHTQRGIPYLSWSDAKPGTTIFGGRPGSGFLEGFIELGSATDETILAFARRWGMLLICRHAVPATHSPDPWPVYQDPSGFFGKDSSSLLSGISDGCRPISLSSSRYARSSDHANPLRHIEPISSWRLFSDRFRSMLNIAALLHRGQRPTEDHWEPLAARPPESGEVDDLLWPKANLAQNVDDMLRLGNVRFGYEWIDGSAPQITYGTPAMFSGLALQLTLAVARADSPATCSACARIYVPERRPNAARRNYCPVCREAKIPLRDAARAHRARKKEEA